MALVFDLGANNGDDTAYYLSLGHHVIAVEADPRLAQLCRTRFAADIDGGRLEIVEAAITDRDGEATFYVSADGDVWSSIDSTHAGSGTPLTVPAIRFRSLVEQYGIPHYAKIDIEGADHFCLADLDPASLPEYLSFEAGHGRLCDLYLAAAKGYTRFKLISQLDYRQPITPAFHSWDMAVRAVRAELGRTAMVRAARRLRPPPLGRPAEYTWKQSGPFADATDGPWRTADDVAHAWLYHVREARFWAWYDVHCAR